MCTVSKFPGVRSVLSERLQRLQSIAALFVPRRGRQTLLVLYEMRVQVYEPSPKDNTSQSCAIHPDSQRLSSPRRRHNDDLVRGVYPMNACKDCKASLLCLSNHESSKLYCTCNNCGHRFMAVWVNTDPDTACIFYLIPENCPRPDDPRLHDEAQPYHACPACVPECKE